MSLGIRLKSLRLQKNLSQKQLADIIGISRSTLSMYELDLREPDLNTLILFADYFSTTTDFLLGRHEQNLDILYSKSGDELKTLIRTIIQEVHANYSKDDFS